MQVLLFRVDLEESSTCAHFLNVLFFRAPVECHKCAQIKIVAQFAHPEAFHVQKLLGHSFHELVLISLEVLVGQSERQASNPVICIAFGQVRLPLVEVERLNIWLLQWVLEGINSDHGGENTLHKQCKFHFKF